MKKINLFSIVSIFVFSLMLSSCKKETPDTETQSAVDNSICEGEFNTRMMVINSVGIKEQGIKGMNSDTTASPTITVDTTGAPSIRKLTIDYRNGVHDTLGVWRKGKIVTTFYGNWSSPNAKATAKLVDYYVSTNGGSTYIRYNVDSITIVRTATNSFTNAVIGGKCTSSSWNLEWASSRTYTQTNGFNSPNDPSDDVFSVTGAANGKDRNGKTYTTTIVNPIVKKANCSWIESGRIDIKPEGLDTRTLDYGNGECDSKVTLIINGNSFTFNLN